MVEIKELYWVAGIIEGEGSFSVVYERGHPQIRVRVNMTEKAVLKQLQKITGIGRITGPYTKSGRKDTWVWQVGKQSDAAGLMMTIYPLMWDNRQERIEELLALWRNDKGYGRRYGKRRDVYASGP